MMSAFIILLCIQIAMTVDLPKKKPIDPREIKWSAVGPLQADKINTHDPWLSKSLWHEDGRFNFTEKIYEIDRTDSFKRMHIQDDIMSYLPDSPYKEPGKQLSTNVEKTSNSGTKELSEFMKTNKRIKKYFNGPTKRDRYLSETMMAKGGQWGTENEVIATAMLLKTSIYVFATHLRKWILYNKDIENQNKPGEDEMCIYIRNLRELHYDVVIDIGNKEMYLH
ncbi:uncharacterized protein LOC126844131 isoform X2 [Adelges cooleyi]|uniref:uncharacterized protein LOC126844131 isoform X2 n=1 Tax=Adelges cooleyi TaxID=133065 RepID=UPI00217F7E0D|nr:uncharacterized protein LOC126844131 isoform X2 [Adelges cooleyi]